MLRFALLVCVGTYHAAGITKTSFLDGDLSNSRANLIQSIWENPQGRDMATSELGKEEEATESVHGDEYLDMFMQTLTSELGSRGFLPTYSSTVFSIAQSLKNDVTIDLDAAWKTLQELGDEGLAQWILSAEQRGHLIYNLVLLPGRSLRKHDDFSVPRKNQYEGECDRIPKIIWTNWDSGITDQLQSIIDSWVPYSKGWELRQLSYNRDIIGKWLNVEGEAATSETPDPADGDYMLPTGFFADIDLKPWQNPDDKEQILEVSALRTDVLRLAMLHKYGGVWLDATVFIRKALDWLHDPEWSDMCDPHKKFAAYSSHGRGVVSKHWMAENNILIVKPGSEIVRKWYKLSKQIFGKRNREAWLEEMASDQTEEGKQLFHEYNYGEGTWRLQSGQDHGPKWRSLNADPYLTSYYAFSVVMHELSMDDPGILQREAFNIELHTDSTFKFMIIMAGGVFFKELLDPSSKDGINDVIDYKYGRKTVEFAKLTHMARHALEALPGPYPKTSWLGSYGIRPRHHTRQNVNPWAWARWLR